MAFILLIASVLIGLYFILNWFVSMDSKTLAKALKVFSIIIGMILALVLLLTGRGLLGLSIGVLLLPFLYKNLSLIKNKKKNADFDDSSSPLSSFTGAMSIEEAEKILEVDKNASREEIIKAHKNMIRVAHPDHGGSAYLSQQINRAKEVLLKDR